MLTEAIYAPSVLADEVASILHGKVVKITAPE
jgi:hypothetical protein